MPVRHRPKEAVGRHDVGSDPDGKRFLFEVPQDPKLFADRGRVMAVAVGVAFYDFCRVHESLRLTTGNGCWHHEHRVERAASDGAEGLTEKTGRKPLSSRHEEYFCHESERRAKDGGSPRILLFLRKGVAPLSFSQTRS